MKIYNSLDKINDIAEEYTPSKIIIITTEKVSVIADWAIQKIKEAGQTEVIHISDGESAKEWQQLEILLDSLITKNADKKTMLIAVGGGTVGDLTGFAASIYRRGISYVQVPTTLLSQVDSAYGGKTGINFKKYKNVIGSTYDPLAVIVDKRFIEKLPESLIIDGMGEIIKYGLISDPSILDTLKYYKIGDQSTTTLLADITVKSAKIKLSFTQADRNDEGIRQMLNVGHTIGHALELEYGLSHGTAVLIGIIKELEVGEKLGITDAKVKTELLDLLNTIGIHIKLDHIPKWESIEKDKKVRGGVLTLPLIEKPGKAILHHIELEKLKELIY
jgi:3-dehydroquinate synthase